MAEKTTQTQQQCKQKREIFNSGSILYAYTLRSMIIQPYKMHRGLHLPYYYIVTAALSTAVYRDRMEFIC